MELVIILGVALGSYALHDTAQLYVASWLKRRVNGKRVGFPADITSYFNLQRIGLTIFWGLGWSSEFHFLYRDASQFRWGRLGVMLLHLFSPIFYLVMALFWFYIGYYLSILPDFIRTFFIGNLSYFNLSMVILMLIPIPPLSMGRLLFSYYTKVGMELKLRQLEFYGNLLLVGIILASQLFHIEIIPFDTLRQETLILLQKIGLLKI
ncbi:hypothetical protein [Entomospira culicis]|uniref:Peptidase M50 domain-containing protein n=1 Tax=Entomospira culicis TaxID=2719989 RepID=A0A968GF07_9SPIO|nr:hypothetical protein [Entomospira culicis]NIZ18603.1 hypothetical protein [Entomospira culicis]NIZ68818.1 hypothetical protein [Entomospira culicis]WDI37414.1 hypothetical protein PVA46_01095 [Entomospira culicis]WDI39042.1 hypothetical protein PVA47_01100 [Entomospira culicis]